ncbi:MAG: CpsD/CapB family tyrosine-protein kinase, partial [Proteobacteria bacterium]|nr:CpsD/CapB family tyrosine-protein kinase [Pseudomonadota bacterium]
MPLIPDQQRKRNGVLLLENLHDEFLSLVLEKIHPGPDDSLSLCLSSCRQEEGVSTIVFNMAIALSRNIQRRILLVDANTRRPKLHSWFKLSLETPGLIDVLEGEASFDDVLHKNEDGMFALVTTGKKARHPIVLFDGKTLDQFLTQARQQFDIIIFDSPSLQAGPEAIVLARKLDGFILVIEAEKTRWEVATYHKE